MAGGPDRMEPVRGWLQKELTALREQAEASKQLAQEANDRAERAEQSVLNEARVRRDKRLISKPIDAFTRVPATLVRDWIRTELLPDVVPRLYDIAMGLEKFDFVVEDKDGKRQIILVGASAAVQVQAAATLLNAGLARVPEELNPDELPGVYALGELELTDLQRIQAPPQPHGNGNGHSNGGPAMLAASTGSQALFSETTGGTLSPETPAADHDEPLEYVEIEEDAMRPLDGQTPGETPPPPVPEGPPTLEQQILAKRRSRRAANQGNDR